jgi:hypothetical protein
MKRTFAVVALLAALGVLSKLAWKGTPGEHRTNPGASPIGSTAARPSEPDPESALRARYPDPRDRALVERTLARYHLNALAIERTDGLRGLTLLDRLDVEALYLYEKHPNDFRRLRESLTDNAAAELLLHWREYFGLKRADDTDRGVLIAEIARLSPAQRKAAARHPAALPLILAEPAGMTELIERWSSEPKELADALVMLEFVSLERGASDLRAALRTLENHGPMAVQAFRLQGLDGFALVTLYGPLLDALGSGLPLEQSLILLRVNSDDVDDLLLTRRAETVAGYLRHVAAAGLVDAVGGSPHALRLSVEFGDRGDRALTLAGSDAADVVYEDFNEPALRRQAVEAIAEHGTIALAMLDKYATDADFRAILRTHGAAIIPPIARSDTGPEALAALRAKSKRSFSETLALSVLSLSDESGQATIKTIKNDGLQRVAELSSTELEAYQFLPLYDLLHLGNVVRRGYAPTSGEMTWALIDGCFVVADVLSLLAVQPEGAAAAEAARSQVKVATREAAKTIGREVSEQATDAAARALVRRGAADGAQAATERVARWWSVRLAGGTYRVLRRVPEALPRLSVAEVADLGRALCARAGFKLSTWGPLRFLKEGREVVLRIPPGRGLKYLAAQGAQAGIGVVAFHKMEEHLTSRRPRNP